jgi:hypothetical protein
MGGIASLNNSRKRFMLTPKANSDGQEQRYAPNNPRITETPRSRVAFLSASNPPIRECLETYPSGHFKLAPNQNYFRGSRRVEAPSDEKLKKLHPSLRRIAYNICRYPQNVNGEARNEGKISGVTANTGYRAFCTNSISIPCVRLAGIETLLP